MTMSPDVSDFGSLTQIVTDLASAVNSMLENETIVGESLDAIRDKVGGCVRAARELAERTKQSVVLGTVELRCLELVENDGRRRLIFGVTRFVPRVHRCRRTQNSPSSRLFRHPVLQR